MGDVTPLPDQRFEDPWARLRRHTSARIALGRTGVSLGTARNLEFQVAHAQARTAVHSALDLDALEQAVGPLVRLTSRAPDRAAYLQRPDRGRRLDDTSAQMLETQRKGADLAIVLADGLSSLATQDQAPGFLSAFLPLLDGFSVAPLVAATQARVAIGDEIGAILNARMVVVLIGERPGLSAADSLGLYLTFGPKRGRTDADRNCISNIRPRGLSSADAAHRAAWLVREAFRLGLSGVGLKDRTVTVDARLE
ncbi:ethanolamine ammonia-lyase [Salipiger aestuarii]|uniref:Ethanolamine ammonia-lyase small subunit n=1 Tax=Salipiger aestuarii TaxID=568098 RepID=A0A327XZD9_9RHOB|nr:ethanolamine ammonia-lyase subunit EutC [Salipiger aestuarii]KAA8606986.1 ethanolamine ammonia-lyase [Salipiger aestuarii]KAA8610749.1 ethanolamine ammonia-lyase [Salipiger aestuarii]KAB2541515.1 ethanolamine ammonia-lyase [Salipiger aestuarii]RAK14120.1 ethanolamine ammonia-lyase light chain [Salipiger aestuarii]